jgi:hypothetical protein
MWTWRLNAVVVDAIGSGTHASRIVGFGGRTTILCEARCLQLVGVARGTRLTGHCLLPL